jgi:processive 1,2-diacylglycerol beta-glucosyltransferase
MRILIATVTAGGGHLAAAAAMEEAWRAARPNDTLQKIDLLTLFSSVHRKIYSDGYVKLIERAPELWGMVFAKSDNPKLLSKFKHIRKMFPSGSKQRFARAVTDLKPDAVICTHYLPLETLTALREKTDGPHPFVTSIVTDFEAHALWMESCVDLYCVAAEETKARLVARGADTANVIATGIPIAAKFSAKIDTKAVRKNYGLRDDMPVLLVLSGGFGMGPVAEILTALDKVDGQFQIMVVTGRNNELRRELAVQNHSHPTHVLGFSTNMHELMAIADLIITKPGGLTSSESLAMGKPLFILNPIPGQEAANSDFLLERGAAAKANRVEDLPFRIEQLLGSKKLGDMAKAARKLGQPRSAENICDEILARMERRQN